METEQYENKSNEKEYYQEKISQIKSLNLLSQEYFKIGVYIDIMDESRNWCVGQIIDRLGDTITVHYEGCNSKSDETFSLKRLSKYHQFRRYSRGYSGLKKAALRNYIFNIDDVNEFEKEIKSLRETKFSNFTDPIAFTQQFRGRIFTFIDIFMTTSYNSKEQSFAIPSIHNLLLEYINMSIEYFLYYKQNLHIVNSYLIKNKDLYLVDPKCAVLASIYEVIVTLRRILGEDPRVSEFYRTNEDAIKKVYKQSAGNEANSRTKICIEKAYKNNSEYNKLPAVIVASMIDYFNEQKGFEAMWSIMLPDNVYSAVNPNLTDGNIATHVHFETMDLVLNFFQLYKIIIDFKNVFSEEILPFKTYFTARIMNLTENEIKELRKGLVVNSIKNISLLIPFDSKLQKFFFEELYLTYHYKCVTSKNLEKRIAGITAINLIIDTIERKEMSRLDDYSYPIIGNKIESDENIELTDSKALIGFFKDKNFLDALLGENIHEEIIKRGINFFKLLAKKNSNTSNNTNGTFLNESVYDLIWKNYEDKHESIAMQIENIICELSFYISDKEKLYLFNKIKSYAEKINITKFSNPFSGDSNFFAVTRKTINFLRKFSENCISKNSMAHYTMASQLDINEEKLYGLPLLWNYMQDSCYMLDPNADIMLTDSVYNQSNTPQTIEIIELSSQSIFNLLNLDTVDDIVKEKILNMCFDNVVCHVSVVQSINLIVKVIGLFPNFKCKKFVKTLDEKYSIVKLLGMDLQRYLYKTREVITKENNFSQIENIYEGCYTHHTNIESRLDLIYFFCNEIRDRGRIEFPFECMLLLWKDFMDSRDEMEKNLFIESITKNCEFFDNVLSESILTKIMLNIELFDWARFTPASYRLFEKLFYSVNTFHKKLINDGRTYRIQLEDIIGLEKLYEIICQVDNSEVRSKFAKLLSSLFTDFKVYNEEFCNRFWAAGVEKILLLLSSNYQSKNKIAIKGIISFIKNLIKEIGNPGEIPQQDDITFPREGLEYTFVNPDKNESRTIRIGKNELTCEVRFRIAFFFDIPVNILKLKLKQRVIELNDDFKIFVEVCQNSTSIEVKEGTHPILQFKNNPKNLLMGDPKLNKILYELLHNSHEGYIQDVWELVNILPKNVELEEEIFELGKNSNFDKNFDLNKFFDEQSIYVMSYSLKMIKSIIFRSDKENNKSETLSFAGINKEWILNFSKNKGLSRLMILFFEFKIEHFNSDLGYECLNDLIYILKPINDVTDCFENNPDNLIRKIFQIIHFIIFSSLDKDKNEQLKEMQDNFKKQRDREFFNSKNSSTNDNFNLTTNYLSSIEANFDLGEEYCEEIVKIFNIEDESIRNLFNFIDDVGSQYKDTKSVCIYKNILDWTEEIKEIVTIGLICPKNYKLKITIKDFFKRILDLLSFEEEDLARLFKSTLFELMLNKDTLSLSILHQDTCCYFFKILAAMLEEYLDPLAISSGIIKLNFNSLAEFLINYIISKESNEVKNSQSEDNVLEGYLLLIRVLIIKSRELSENINKNFNLIDLILNRCLLSKCQVKSSSAPFPKCTTLTSRENAYRLLSALSYNNPDITAQIFKVLNNYHILGYWKSKRLLDWKISLANDEKSSTGYVGLKNLGCTCYMNSLIQQFFMIPPLRESILASPDNKVSDINKQEISSLFQMKNIFASLKAYDGQYYNAKDFCLNFDGAVLDIKEQMDVDEFFNTLIDKLEDHTKGTPYQNLFKHFFGFTISDEFICKGCPHYSEREQYFNSIQLQVLNKKTITESLKSYIEGELLEGDNAYYCEKCDKKVNTLKRQCIKKLPKMLIIVLKRFEFDYENMIKIKVNDYLEFPHELNMEPYTQEYLEKIEKSNKNQDSEMKLDEEKHESETDKNVKPGNYYKYNLSGVVIHSGTSENGHYYSMIKDYVKNDWYEFNDVHVKEYDVNDLGNDAFGGTETVTKDNRKETVEKTTNAYLLFYKRQYEEFEEEEILQKMDTSPSENRNYSIINHINNSKEEEKDNQQTVITKWSKYSNISPAIMDRIDLDNFQYWVSKIIFSSEYHSFITDLLVNSNLYDNAIYNYSTKNDNKETYIDFVNLRNSVSSISDNKIEMQVISDDFQSCLRKGIPQILNQNVDSNLIVNPNIYSKNDFVIISNREYELTLFKFACLFFLNVLIRAKDKNYLPSVLDWLKAMINKNSTYANWLLEEFSNNDLITEYLIDPQLTDVKKLIVGLVYCAMISSYKSIMCKNSATIDKSEMKLEKNSSLILFIGNIFAYMIKNTDKDLSSVYYVIYRFSLLGEYTLLFLIQNGFLHFLANYYANKISANNSINSAICFSHPIDALGYLKLREFTTPKHKELDQKLMNRIEKLSAWEEMTEKKFMEKNSTQRSDYYLLMTFSQLIIAANINVKNISVNASSTIKLDSEILQVLRFNNADMIRCLLLEAKSKQAAASLSKLIRSICANNVENTNCVQQVILETLSSMDAGEFDFILIVFKSFMLDIDDSLKDSRLKTSLVKYLQIVIENTRYWSYMDSNIDFIIKLLHGNGETFKNCFDGIKDYLIKIMKYLKDNPCPPTMTPSKTQTMYRRRYVTFPNKLNQFQLNGFNTKYTNIANDKISKLKEIYNKISHKLNQYDADMDLTDFKFFIGDRVKFEGFNATVINILDEMINIEYDKIEISNTKRPPFQWIETDNRNLHLVELVVEKNSENMQKIRKEK